MSTRTDGLEEILRKSIGKHVSLHLRSRADESVQVEGILKAITEEYIMIELLSGTKTCSETYINRKFTMLLMLDVWKEPQQ